MKVHTKSEMIALKDRAKSHGRSAVSNGRDILPDVDGRSLIARRYRDITNAILLDAGGLENCSEARAQLIRRFSACSVLAELIEADLANGKTVSIADHAQLSSTLTRLASRIGIDRRSRDITPPTVEAYLAHVAKQKAEQSEDVE
jgi:hypothetical protein